MAINYNTIITLDFETGGINPHTCEPLQLAAVAMNPRSLEIEENGSFQVYIKPTSWESVSPEALAVNKITKEIIEEKGVEQKLAWLDFVKWVNKYNKKGDQWNAPIMAGHNIIGFDTHIVNRMCKLYGPCHKDTGQPTLFNKIHQIDLMFILFLWTENSNILPNYKLDTLREATGISKSGGHNAIKDVEDTAFFISRFMKLHRRVAKTQQFIEILKNGMST